MQVAEKPVEQPKFPVPKTSRIYDKIMPDYAIPCISSGDDLNSRMLKRKLIQDVSREIPIYPDPPYRPPPKPVKSPIPQAPQGLSDFDPEINMDFKKNSPFQESVISEIYQRPDKSYFQELQELDSLINTGRLVKKLFPKQADIDKIFIIIQRKALKGMHLSVTVKIQA